MCIFLKRTVVKRIRGNLRRTIHNILVYKLTTAHSRIGMRHKERSLKAVLTPKTKLLLMMCSGKAVM